MGRSRKWLRKFLGVKKFFKSTSKESASATARDQKETDSTPTENHLPALPTHLVQESVLTAIPERESTYSELEDVHSKETRQGDKLKELAVEENVEQNSACLTSTNLHRACKSESLDAAEEQAAIKIQKAFRRYLAYRAVRALKGLVRLQALVRGHAVRKQAAISLRCVEAIVKFQANFRGSQVRVSPEGRAVRKQLGLWPKKQEIDSPENWLNKQSKIRNLMSQCNGYYVNEDTSAGKRKTYKQRVQAYAATTQYSKNLSGDCNKGSGWIWLELWTASKPWASLSFTEKSVSTTYGLDSGAKATKAVDCKPCSKGSNISEVPLSNSEKQLPSASPPDSERPIEPLRADVQEEPSEPCEISLEILSLSVSPRLAAQISPALSSSMSDRCGTAVSASPTTPGNPTKLFSHASCESVENNFPTASDNVVSADDRKPMSKSDPSSTEKLCTADIPAPVAAVPSYMATTESSKAKARSYAAARQQVETSDRTFSTAKRRLSHPGSNGRDSSEVLHVQKWNSGVRTHRTKAFTTSPKYIKPQAV